MQACGQKQKDSAISGVPGVALFSVFACDELLQRHHALVEHQELVVVLVDGAGRNNHQIVDLIFRDGGITVGQHGAPADFAVGNVIVERAEDDTVVGHVNGHSGVNAFVLGCLRADGGDERNDLLLFFNEQDHLDGQIVTAHVQGDDLVVIVAVILPAAGSQMGAQIVVNLVCIVSHNSISF